MSVKTYWRKYSNKFVERLGKSFSRDLPIRATNLPWRLIFNTDLSQVHFYIHSALADHPLYMCEPEYLDIGIAYNHFTTGLDEVGIVGGLVIEEPEIEKPKGSFYIASWCRDY